MNELSITQVADWNWQRLFSWRAHRCWRGIVMDFRLYSLSMGNFKSSAASKIKQGEIWKGRYGSQKKLNLLMEGFR